jgi:hypothetical protein
MSEVKYTFGSEGSGFGVEGTSMAVGATDSVTAFFGVPQVDIDRASTTRAAVAIRE